MSPGTEVVINGYDIHAVKLDELDAKNLTVGKGS